MNDMTTPSVAIWRIIWAASVSVTVDRVVGHRSTPLASRASDGGAVTRGSVSRVIWRGVTFFPHIFMECHLEWTVWKGQSEDGPFREGTTRANTFTALV